MSELDEIRAAVHRDCNYREHRCPCVCGCETLKWCDCWSMLCSICWIWVGRGDDDHGYPGPGECKAARGET